LSRTAAKLLHRNRRWMMDTVVEKYVWTGKVYRLAEHVEICIEVQDDGVYVATSAGWDDFQLMETDLSELHSAIEAQFRQRYPEQVSLLFLENGEQVPL
jgi:hypothetical protein